MSNKRKRYTPRKSETDCENDSETDCYLAKTTYKIKREIIEKEIPIDTGERLAESFFNTSCEELAKNLLGKILVRQLDHGAILKGRSQPVKVRKNFQIVFLTFKGGLLKPNAI